MRSAARSGTSGRQTREVRDWHPSAWLCRCVGVEDPHPAVLEKGDLPAAPPATPFAAVPPAPRPGEAGSLPPRLGHHQHHTGHDEGHGAGHERGAELGAAGMERPLGDSATAPCNDRTPDVRSSELHSLPFDEATGVSSAAAGGALTEAFMGYSTEQPTAVSVPAVGTPVGGSSSCRGRFDGG
eukprot:Hpha_TRINITY_DN25202_c0_g1::TRINITY_DN25202_c0_g1_i1::g.110787::m.110787